MHPLALGCQGNIIIMIYVYIYTWVRLEIGDLPKCVCVCVRACFPLVSLVNHAKMSLLKQRQTFFYMCTRTCSHAFEHRVVGLILKGLSKCGCSWIKAFPVASSSCSPPETVDFRHNTSTYVYICISTQHIYIYMYTCVGSNIALSIFIAR